MADSTDGASNIVGARTESVPGAGRPERSGSVVGEFVDAAREAAESLLEEQKRQIAERVSGIAEALHSAARSLDQSENKLIARYVGQAADQVTDISHTVRDRRWNEIAADTEDFARRQPIWFVAGAVAAGFVVGRLLWAATNGQRDQSDTAGLSSGETSRTVAAAVSSGVIPVAGDVAANRAASPGVVETP